MQYEEELKDIMSDIKEYITEKDGMKAMVMWISIQKRISSFRKAVI